MHSSLFKLNDKCFRLSSVSQLPRYVQNGVSMEKKEYEYQEYQQGKVGHPAVHCYLPLKGPKRKALKE